MIAHNTSLVRTFISPTTSRGAFRLDRLPKGTYSISVIDSGGNTGVLSWVHDGESTKQLQSDVTLAIAEGVNVAALSLRTPPWAEPVIDADLLPDLTDSPSAARLPFAKAAATTESTTISCDPGRPKPLSYPPPPDASSRVVFGVRRGPDEILSEGEDPCGKVTALGCTQPELERVPRRVPSDGIPVCRADGLLVLPTDVLETTIDLRPPGSARYSSDPPTASDCVEILKPNCGGPAGFHTFEGAKLHECVHRTDDEQRVAKHFEEFLKRIRGIQQEIDAQGRCYECCKRREQRAIDAYLDVRRQVSNELNAVDEQAAYAAECAHYKRKYENLCKAK